MSRHRVRVPPSVQRILVQPIRYTVGEKFGRVRAPVVWIKQHVVIIKQDLPVMIEKDVMKCDQTRNKIKT